MSRCKVPFRAVFLCLYLSLSVPCGLVCAQSATDWESHCGSVCVYSVCRILDIEADLGQIRERLTPDKDGNTSFTQLVDELRLLGVHVAPLKVAYEAVLVR